MNFVLNDLLLFSSENPRNVIPVINVIFCRFSHHKSEHGRGTEDFVKNSMNVYFMLYSTTIQNADKKSTKNCIIEISRLKLN